MSKNFAKKIIIVFVAATIFCTASFATATSIIVEDSDGILYESDMRIGGWGTGTPTENIKNNKAQIIIYTQANELNDKTSNGDIVNGEQDFLSNGGKIISSKEEYEEKAYVIKNNINEVTEQIKVYNDYKDSVNDKINVFLNNTQDVNDAKANEIKRLIRLLPQGQQKEKVLSANTSIGNYVKNEEFDKALEKLNATYEEKQNQLNAIKEEIVMWQEIDELINSY